MARAFRCRARARRCRRRRRAIRGGQLLARPGCVHLEHQDRRGTCRDRGHAPPHARGCAAARLARDRGPHDRRRRHRRMDRVRDGRRPGQGAPAADRRQSVDAADRARRARGPRAGTRAAAAQGRRPRRQPRAPDLARGPRARGRRAGPHDPAVRGYRRRRPGRDRARRAAAPAASANDHRRAQPPPRRLMAQPIQVAVPPRPRVVRPPAVRQVPAELAGVLAQGQDRRLARDVRARDGDQLLGVDDREERRVRRGRRRVGSRRGPRWGGDHASPEAARAGHRHVRPPLHAGVRGHRPVQGRPAALLRSPGTGWVPRQARGGDRLQQLRPRHLRGPVGARSRRDDGAAVLDARGAVGHADGHRAQRPLLRAGGRRWNDDREGRPDVCVAALPDHGRAPGPGVRADPRARRRLLRPARGRRLPARLGRGRIRAVHEVPAPRVGLLHRRGRVRARGQRPDQAATRPGRPPHRGRQW